MQIKTLGLFLLFALSFLAICVSAAYVVDLTDSKYEDFLEANKKETVLVEYFAPWCGHCQALAPEYEELAKKLKGKVIVARIDCQDAKRVAQIEEIQHFPTIKLFSNGAKTDYSGQRTAADLELWIHKKSQPPVTRLETASEAKKLIEENEVVVVARFATKDEKTKQSFWNEAVVDDFYEWAEATTKEAADAIGQKAGVITLYRKFDVPISVPEHIENPEEFRTWLSFNGLPLVLELTPTNYVRFARSGPHSLVFFQDNYGEAEIKLLSDVSSKLAKFHIGYTAGSRYSDAITRMGSSGKKFPTAFAWLTTDVDPIVWDETIEFNAENFLKWLEQVLGGTAQTYKKSEEIPEASGPVRVLVGKNHDEVISDPTHDVLVEYYAPWCGHCKQLEPIWESLASHLSNDPSIIIAKIDHTANYLDPKNVEVTGYPTIKFYTGTDRKPIDFTGERTLEGALSWLKTNRASAGRKEEL